MNILDKRATNPAAALDGTELVYVAQLGADAVTTVQDIKDFATNGFLLITTAASTYVAKNAPITGATKTKITYNTDGLITSGADATTADIADSPDRRYITDAQQTVLNNTSNTNSGDETTATIKTKLGAASSTADGYLTSTDWTTFNGKQEPLADVITANTYGSSTQYPIVTVNAKGIVTGVTLQTVAPTFSDSAFRIQDNADATKQLAFEVSGIATATTRTWTVPDSAINFGDLPSVATTNFNVLGGTNCRIEGGNNNNVSGTDNIAIGCTGVITASSLAQYIQASSGDTISVDWPTRFIGSGTLRGTSGSTTELATVITQLKTFNVYDAGSAVLTTDGGSASASNTPRHAGACPYDDPASDIATHELDMQVVTRFSTGLYVNTGVTCAKYLISVLGTTAVATLVSACANGTVATFTVTPTVVGGRLHLTVSNTTGSDRPIRVRGVLKSLYSYL